MRHIRKIALLGAALFLSAAMPLGALADGQESDRPMDMTSDEVVLLDEHGKEFRSLELADWLGRRLNASGRDLVFVVGGAYGFSDAVYARADGKLSLSKMTFSHQLVRTIFAEQLYRAFTILRGEPYHHE